MTDNYKIISLTVICLLILFIIGLIIYSTSIRSSLIDPLSCPVTSGDFGVRPQTSGTTASICGENSDILCNFSEVVDVGHAINICNGVNNCNAFVYNQTNHVMSIINTNDATYDDTSYDLYSRQTPIIIV